MPAADRRSAESSGMPLSGPRWKASLSSRKRARLLSGYESTSVAYPARRLLRLGSSSSRSSDAYGFGRESITSRSRPRSASDASRRRHFCSRSSSQTARKSDGSRAMAARSSESARSQSSAAKASTPAMSSRLAAKSPRDAAIRSRNSAARRGKVAATTESDTATAHSTKRSRCPGTRIRLVGPLESWIVITTTWLSPAACSEPSTQARALAPCWRTSASGRNDQRGDQPRFAAVKLARSPASAESAPENGSTARSARGPSPSAPGTRETSHPSSVASTGVRIAAASRVRRRGGASRRANWRASRHRCSGSISSDLRRGPRYFSGTPLQSARRASETAGQERPLAAS